MTVQQHVVVTDHAVRTPGGMVFARELTPRAYDGATPIMLLHDSLGCVEVWREFPQVLSVCTGRRVIAYDRLGFGRSAPRTDRLRRGFIEEEAPVFLPPLLDHFGIDRFIPFGHSVGGGMAIGCGTALANACEAIITESAQTFMEDVTRQGIVAARARYADPAQVERLRRYHGDKALWVLRAWIETWLSDEFASWSLRHVLPQVSVPMLVMHGDRDEFGTLAHPELARALSGGRVEVSILEDTGHVPHRDRPDIVVERVAEFLGSLPRMGRQDATC